MAPALIRSDVRALTRAGRAYGARRVSSSAWIKQANDFSAAFADKLTGRASAKLRDALGYEDVVDRTSNAYRYGSYPPMQKAS